MELNIQKNVVFPTEIYRVTLDDQSKPLMDLANKIKSQDSGVSLSNKGGWQSNKFKAGEYEQTQFLENFLQSFITDVLQQEQLNITGLWFNITPKNGYNARHCHTDYINSKAKSILSGIFYINVNRTSGNLVLHDPIFPDNEISHAPLPNELIIIPSYLQHSVEPNKSDDNRVSLAFNFEVK